MIIKRLLIFILVIILLGLLSLSYPYLTGKAVSNSNQEYKKEICFVERVIDGDTLVCNNQTIRLLGINTPEKKMPYYQEAQNFLKQIENKTIEILRDSEDLDKYDRKLRYVFYQNTFLNLRILEEGFATSFMLDNLKYEKELKNAEKSAINNQKRLWEKSKDICANCIKLIELNYTDEFFIIKNNCNLNCDLSNWIIKDDANHLFKLENLSSKQERRYDSKIKVWNDEGDRFFIRDEEGGLVLFYEYRGITQI